MIKSTHAIMKGEVHLYHLGQLLAMLSKLKLDWKDCHFDQVEKRGAGWTSEWR